MHYTQYLININPINIPTHFVNVSFQDSLMQTKARSLCDESGKTWFSSQLNLNRFSKRLTNLTPSGI